MWNVRGCVRLRSSRKNIQPSAIGTPQCLGLRPLRARSQPRVTRQRLQSVESRGEPCSRCRACEAAYGCAAVVKPFNRVRRVHRSAWGYDRFALDRSLVLLVSDYITWRAVESRVAAVERARLRTAAQQSQNIQPSATGTPQCLGLRPLRARSQPRVTRQRLQNVENRVERARLRTAAQQS